MALGALEALRARGRRVPEDVAVVGFDDLAEIAEATDPPLTTVHQDVGEMGRLMARLLFDRPSDLPSVVVPTRLVLRASA
jgi:DNA-binding LacI/PurR family transcriptional regulator